jgi:Fur family zinc uptake transcriptional regulator
MYLLNLILEIFMHLNSCSKHNICVENAINNAENLLAAKNIKLTLLRRKILELIWQNQEPVKAYDLIEKLRAENILTKPVTLYRILDVFLNHSLLHKVESENSYIGCSKPALKNNCYFFICTKCNKIKERFDEKVTQAIYNSCKAENFTPTKIMLEIKGMCSDCL